MEIGTRKKSKTEYMCSNEREASVTMRLQEVEGKMLREFKYGVLFRSSQSVEKK